MEITLVDVEINRLRDKIKAWEILTDGTCNVQVSGTFRDRKGELAFLENRLYPVDTASIGRSKYIKILLEGDGWTELTTDQATIDKVRLTSKR